MRAAVFGGIGTPLSVEERPVPLPGSGEVVIKVEMCGICASDLELTSDNFMTLEIGSILGHEFAGQIEAVGRDVDNLRVGDRVTALPRLVMTRGGAYAEYAPAVAALCVKLPSSLSFADGALVEPLSVGLKGVLLGDLSPRSKVLVLGAGPIGLAAVFWARRGGAEKVVVEASSDRRSHLAEVMGATGFVARDRVGEESATELLGGAPDVVFECVGRPGILSQAIERVRKGGTIVVLGACMVPDAFIPMKALIKEVQLQFSLTYDLSHFFTSVKTLEKGDLSPRSLITDTIPLSDLPDVFESLRSSNPHCKVMVDPTR
jgi:(R,R)-butanediol dehydrogenase/meso-butanediol dehydrogenase/diacetyl reductase